MEKIEYPSGILVNLDAEETRKICKLGQGEKCCAYLVMGADGFQCSKKESTLSEQISGRLILGILKHKGEGSWEGCPWEYKMSKRVV